MKPSLPVLTYVDIHKAKIIKWRFKFWVHPYKALVGFPKAHPAKIILFVLFCSFCNGQGIRRGSSVVAVIGGNDITLAADSLEINVDGSNRSRSFCTMRFAPEKLFV